MKLTYRQTDVVVPFSDGRKTMASAATAAMRNVASDAVSTGRAHIASAGFSDGYFKWQSGYKAEVFPRNGKDSLRPAIRLGHSVGIASVFEEGTTIRPKKSALLWVPLKNNLPQGFRGGPKNFPGQLASVNRPGRAPLLVGKTTGSKKAVPVFVGISAATMPKRFSLYEIGARAADKFEGYYNQNLKV